MQQYKDLEQILKECAKASDEGYAEAKQLLNKIEAYIDEASRVLNETINDIRTRGSNDNSLLQSVRNQLTSVQKTFKSTYIETYYNVETKHKQTSSFNITLFGKTKAGKSTLMEILTNGNGQSIGKGGQRTTLDVRQYEWHGLTITDVPGIEAYGGENDDKLAAAAAMYADLILFLITAGQPENKEAEWLVKLRKTDKPVICICNTKTALGGDDDPNGFRMKRFLRNPMAHLQSINIDDIILQFNKFIQEKLPNEKVDILVVHLLARFLANKSEYASSRVQLIKASNFSALERRLIGEISGNALLYRKRCYLSIIDSPIYTQMQLLLKFSEDSYRQFMLVESKLKDFVKWEEYYLDESREKVNNIINNAFRTIEYRLPSFIDQYMECSDFSDRWNDYVEYQDIPSTINSDLKQLYDECSNKIGKYFEALREESDFTANFNHISISNDIGLNWKKTFEWGGNICGAIGAIAFLCASNPVGWAFMGISAVLGFFGWLSDSREKKRNRERQKISDKLFNNIEEAKEKAKKDAYKWFEKNINKNMMSDAYYRFKSLETSMIGLTNSQRSLALKYAECHISISKTIILNILDEIDCHYLYDVIINVARIPGKQIFLLVNTRTRIPIGQISGKLGGKERIEVLSVDKGSSYEYIFKIIFQKYISSTIRPFFKEIKTGKGVQTVAYIPYRSYTPLQMDYFNIIQQLTQIHILIK